MLPPLRFTEEEADALMLGLRLVAQREDPSLEEAAADALARIEAALPPGAPPEPARAEPPPGSPPHLATLRRALAEEQRLALDYSDAKARRTRRVVWPVELDVHEESGMLVAWCESRRDFRQFRLDRIAAASPAGGPMPRRRRALLAEWQAARDLEGY